MTKSASVASMNDEPMIAPMPIACESAPVPSTMAMIGMIVSGRAVPTAASIEPTEPSPRPRWRPSHSTELVNSSQPARITTIAVTR